MPLVTSTEMFKKAYAGGYAIGAFNVNNMEMIQAIVEAANEEKAPVILQVSAGARKYANPVYLKHLVEAAVETTDIPIVMHLDHGADFDICKASIDGGFTSVMIDASSKPWEENIAITKKVVEYAHDHGVVVEAELGKLAGVEDDVHVAADDEAGTITVNGKTIRIYAEKDATNCPWGELGVDVVLECTGFYTSKAKSEAHLKAGAKKVVISAPAGNDLPTIVYSVNEKTLTKADTIISAASCTTNCLAPMANTLNKLAKIKKGYMTTIHAYTGDQMVLDGPHRKGDLRRARAAAVNIVPNSTGAAKAIGLVIPELNGVLDGCAQRVPVPTGSLTQLVAICEGEVDAATVNAAMKAASSASFGYTEEELVSSDIVGITYGSLFDATQTKCMPMGDGTTLVKVVSWYDNENSYTSQMVRTIKYFAEL